MAQTLIEKADLIIETLTDKAILRDPKGCKELLFTAESFYIEAGSSIPIEISIIMARINNIYNSDKKYLVPA